MDSRTQLCIERIQKAVDGLRREGMEPLYIAAAIAEVVVNTAEKDAQTADTVLQSVAAIVSAAAESRRGRAMMQSLHDAFTSGPQKKLSKSQNR